jgi:hypothetical protein
MRWMALQPETWDQAHQLRRSEIPSTTMRYESLKADHLSRPCGNDIMRIKSKLQATWVKILLIMNRHFFTQPRKSLRNSSTTISVWYSWVELPSYYLPFPFPRSCILGSASLESFYLLFLFSGLLGLRGNASYVTSSSCLPVKQC